MKLTTYKELIVWQKSVELVEEVYRLTSYFPREELFGITSQLRRACISISSNIIETQLIISKKLRLAAEDKFLKAERLLEEAIKMLYTMVYKRKEGASALVVTTP